MPQTRVVAERVSQPKKNRCEFLTNLRDNEEENDFFFNNTSGYMKPVKPTIVPN